MAGLARRETERQRQAIEELTQRLATSLISEMQLIEARWKQENRAAEEAERLEKALTPILNDKKEEYRARAAAFRNFLDETVQAKIEALVLEAQIAAEKDVKEYLSSLRGAHWGTLRAAVRRGGTFYGSRNINLPDDITGYFLEPMAAVWGQKLLRVIRELRQTVKSELSSTIRQPIKISCEQFVKNGNDIGPGVKLRILELFSDLAKVATSAAKEPAIRILQENATRVRMEVQQELKKGGDPLQDTADLIVESHEARVRRSDAQKRRTVLMEVRAVIDGFPNMSSENLRAEVPG